MSSLASKIRARFNFIFPPTPPPPSPPSSGPTVAGAAAEAARIRRRAVADPIHPDFLGPVDPLWPIPEDALKKNAAHETSLTRRLHPHTAFGKFGFGTVEVPDNITSPIRTLVAGTSSNGTMLM